MRVPKHQQPAQLYNCSYARTILMLMALILVVSPTNSRSQENIDISPIPPGAPIIQYYSGEDIGADAINWGISQDKRGIMYFANENGILEFDGARWTLLATGNLDFARAIDANEEGVFAGGIEEFGYLASDLSGKTLYHSLSDQLDESQRHFGNVWSVHATSHGAYFITNNFIFRWHQGTLDTIELAERNWGFKIYDDVFILHRATTSITRLHDGHMQRLPQTQGILNEEKGRLTILPYANGKLLITTAGNGSFIYHLDKLTQPNNQSTPLLERFVTETNQGFEDNNIYYFSTYTDNQQYIYGSLDGKLFILNHDGSIFRIFDQHNGLNGQAILDVFIDKQKNLWAGTFNGIFHIKLNSPWSVYDISSINSPVIMPLAHDGKLFISSYKGVFYLNTDKPSLEGLQYEFTSIDIPKQQSFALLSDQNNLYAAVQNEIFLIKNLKAQKLIALQENPLILSLEKSNKFPNHFFIGTYSTGLSAMKTQTKNGRVTAELIKLDIPKLNAASIRTLNEDINGDLWISTEKNGIYHMRFLSEKIDDFNLFKYGKQQGLEESPHGTVSFTNDEVIMSKEKGIYRAKLNNQPDNNMKFTLAEDLNRHFSSENHLCNLIEYVNNGLFITDNDGSPFIINNIGNKHSTTVRAPFMSLPDVRSDAGITTTDVYGNIWIAARTTLYRFHPEIEKNYQFKYPAFIRKVTSNTDNTIFNGNHIDQQPLQNETFSTDISTTQAVWAIPQLEYSQNAITFEYSAAFYEHNSKLNYSYMLEGFDKQWSTWSVDNKKEYNYLPEGHYTFRVKAKNAYEYESHEDSYQFTIFPPWYRTLWMYAVYSIAFVLLVIVGMRAYSWRLIRARKKLGAIVRRKTAQLQQRTVQLQHSLENLKATQAELAEASHRAGMADVAKSVLHNVGNALTTIKTSSSILQDRIEQLKDLNKLEKLADLIQGTQEPASSNLTRNPKIQKASEYLRELTTIMSSRRSSMEDEAKRLQASIYEIENLLYEQKNYINGGDFTVEVNIEKLIDALVKNTIASTEENSISVERSIEAFPLFKSQKHKLEQILTHLLKNAIQAVEQSEYKDKKIQIEAYLKSDDQLVISISDNGMGIDENMLTRIFEQNHNAINGCQRHNLHQCANAASEMGGQLTVHSSGIKEGAQFVLQLPIFP